MSSVSDYYEVCAFGGFADYWYWASVYYLGGDF